MLKYSFLLLVSLCLFIAPVLAEETPADLDGVKTIDVDSVKSWLDDGKEFFLLDARKVSDFQAGHLPGAVNCNVNTETDIQAETIQKAVTHLDKCEELKSIDKGFLIVAYCNSTACWQSPKASLALVKMGFTNVNWMRAGINGWKDKGYPVE